MRRIILTLVFLASSAAIGLAQYATVIEEGPDHTYPTFAIAVANDNFIPDNQSIYVVDDGKYQRVKMIQHQNFNTNVPGTVTSLRQFDVPGTIVINDITTVDSLAVFCGHVYTTAQYGVIGYFNLSSLATAPPTGIVLNWHTVEAVTELNKLVAYPVGNRKRVVAIGMDANSPVQPYYVVEVDDIAASPLAVTHAQLPYTTTHKELAHEILLLQHYAMIVGYDGPNVMPCYRLFDKTVGISNNMLNTIHHTTDDILSQPHTTHLRDDLVAMAYLSHDASSNFTTRIRYIDPANGDNYRSEEFMPADKTEPRDIIYWPTGNTIVLAETSVLTSGPSAHTDFVYLNPSATLPYTTIADYHEKDVFHVMTRIRQAQDSYLAVFGDRYMLRCIAAPWPLQDSHCPERDHVKIYGIRNYAISHAYSPCTLAQTPHTGYSDTVSVQIPGVTTICTNY